MLALCGCAAVPPDGPTPPGAAGKGRAPSTLAIAAELVAVLVQLEGHSPYGTTVQVNAPATAFGADLLEALELAGYGIQPVDADQGRFHLAYAATSRASEAGRLDRFELRIGALGIGREVRLVDGRWVPAGPVTIRGAPVQPVALNGSVHVHRPDRPLSYPSGVRFLSDDGSTTVAEALYRYSYWPTGEAGAASDATAPDPTRFVERATGRLYEGGRTGLALRPATDFAPRQRLALRFPGPSPSTLGADNRRALARLADFVDPASDRLAIASCTADGRRSDASTERSARVKAELLVLDVPGDQVLELGCPEEGRRPPSDRDVAITLERLVAS